MGSEQPGELLKDQETEGRYIVNFIKNTNAKGAANVDADYLTKRLERLEALWHAVSARDKVLNRQYEQLKDEIYFKQEFFIVYEEAYCATKAQLETKRKALLPPSPTPPQGNSTFFEDAGEHRTIVVQTAPAPVSVSDLPTFTGIQSEWESFRARFDAKVGKVVTIAAVDKLQLLMACVKGDAASCVSNYEINDANYQMAWAALEARFDNKRLRLTAHLSRLINMQKGSSKSAADIRRLIDDTKESIRALTLLQRPVQQWDDWFIELVLSKLDASTREAWENKQDNDAFPSFNELAEFLEKKARAMASSPTPITSSAATGSASKKSESRAVFAPHGVATPAQKQPQSHQLHFPQPQQQSQQLHFPQQQLQRQLPAKVCQLCKGAHFIGYCPTFISLGYADKICTIQTAKLCKNCLRYGHFANACTSPIRCKVPGCALNHHTILHPDTTTQDVTATSPTSQQSVNTYSCTTDLQTSSVLLATARVTLQSYSGTQFEARALIDPASEGSFISERVAQLLCLKRQPVKTLVSGVGGDAYLNSKYNAHLVLKSQKDSTFLLQFSAIIVDQPTARLPRSSVGVANWSHIRQLPLADPEFHRPQEVDCILGADVYASVLKHGVRTGQPGEPIAQETVFGWILTGSTPYSCDSQPGAIRTHFTSLRSDLPPFWKTKGLSMKPILSKVDEKRKRPSSTTQTTIDKSENLLLEFTTPVQSSYSRDAEVRAGQLGVPAAQDSTNYYRARAGSRLSTNCHRVPAGSRHSTSYYRAEAGSRTTTSCNRAPAGSHFSTSYYRARAGSRSSARCNQAQAGPHSSTGRNLEVQAGQLGTPAARTSTASNDRAKVSSNRQPTCIRAPDGSFYTTTSRPLVPLIQAQTLL